MLQSLRRQVGQETRIDQVGELGFDILAGLRPPLRPRPGQCPGRLTVQGQDFVEELRLGLHHVPEAAAAALDQRTESVRIAHAMQSLRG